MQFSESAVTWAMEKMLALGSCRNAPTQLAVMEAHAKALLRIAHPVIVQHRIKWAQEKQLHPDTYEVTEADLASESSILQFVKIDGENPVDWLISKAVDEAEFYPMPPQMRAWFSRWPTADCREGKGSDDGSGT